MYVSAAGLEKLKEREGERLTAYQDSAGVWTIGVGHTAPWIESGVWITKEKSEALLLKDLVWVTEAINESVVVVLNQHQFDALASFVFNVGDTAFKTSTLLEELNFGNYFEVPNQLRRWNKITINGEKQVLQGLVNRRESEIMQFTNVESVKINQLFQGEEMNIIDKINEFVAGIAPGMKTLLSTLLLTVVSLYASTKGFDAAELQAWLEQGFVHLNSAIVLLGAVTAWFRQLGKITDAKE